MAKTRAKAGKPFKGKGKVVTNQQWQQAGHAKGWGNNQGTNKWQSRIRWQTDGGMQVQEPAFPIVCLSLLAPAKKCGSCNSSRRV